MSATASAVFAQTVDAPQTVPGQTNVIQVDPLRYPIQMMENILVGAVRHAMEGVAQEINAIAPNLPLFTGVGKAHGFILEQYGVMFDVEVPFIRSAIVDNFRSMLSPPLQRGQDPRQPVGTAPSSKESTKEEMLADMIARSPAFQNPELAYTVALKNALTDALLDWTAIKLPPDELITIGARVDDPNTLTMYLTIKASDLALVRAGKLTPDDARSRVGFVQR
jgi:hypothetical protein